jgi:hypothetical protein
LDIWLIGNQGIEPVVNFQVLGQMLLNEFMQDSRAILAQLLAGSR